MLSCADHFPCKSTTKQRMVFRMIHVKIPDPTKGQSLVGLDFLRFCKESLLRRET